VPSNPLSKASLVLSFDPVAFTLSHSLILPTELAISGLLTLDRFPFPTHPLLFKHQYAAHEVINNINNLCNYECFLADPFSLDAQPRVLIFVDNKDLACRIASHLDCCLPPQYQDKGVVKHYHSKMSLRYLQATHEAFTTPSGKCRVLVATSSQSVVCVTSLFVPDLYYQYLVGC
jgi:hypothetical protein